MWVSIAVVFFLAMVFMMAVVVGAGSEADLPTDASILRINLSGTINDRTSTPSVADLMMENAENAQSFETIVAAIQEAAKDKNIKGI